MLSYRFLQQSLKEFRDSGHTIRVPLTSKRELLEDEWERLHREIEGRGEYSLDAKFYDVANELNIDMENVTHACNNVVLENCENQIYDCYLDTYKHQVVNSLEPCTKLALACEIVPIYDLVIFDTSTVQNNEVESYLENATHFAHHSFIMNSVLSMSLHPIWINISFYDYLLTNNRVHAIGLCCAIRLPAKLAYRRVFYWHSFVDDTKADKIAINHQIIKSKRIPAYYNPKPTYYDYPLSSEAESEISRYSSMAGLCCNLPNYTSFVNRCLPYPAE